MDYSIIIPVAKKDSRYLKRCLLSLLDQDCESWEAIVVCDGFKTTSPIDDNRITIKCVDKKKTASMVRNEGAKYATGDLLFFFDVDCVLLPGMLQLMKDKLEKNKDCSFIYGGYRFNHETLTVYPSRPFDPYLLESMNYISTMSPMKRCVFDDVGGFREDLKYFQDWDFFLRAVKYHGHKGHFLKDIIFRTEVPNVKSISGSNEFRFRDKILNIENLNKLDSRNLCVTSLTAPYQAIERAKILNARYIGAHNGSSLIQLPSQFDFGIEAVLLQGFFPNNIQQHMDMLPEDCIKMINWIGTDVWQLRNSFTWEQIKYIRDHVLSNIDVQMCNSPELQNELAELGIKAKLIYQPLTESVKETKLPKKPTVSCYFSKGHPMHNEYFLYDIAKSMPDIDFIFFGTGLDDKVDGNIRHIGFVPIQSVIDMSTMHLRLTEHDGFPQTPIYFLMSGRRVVCNFPLQYADVIHDKPSKRNWESLKPQIVEHIRKKINEPLDFNVKECQDYYNNLCDKNKYRELVYAEIKECREKAKVDSSSANMEQLSVSC